MKALIKIIGLFVLTILFLSIDIKGKTVFAHIHTLISPVTRSAQKTTETFFHDSVKGTKSYSKQIFENSLPKVKDTVREKMSGAQKVAQPAETILPEEKEELDDLIKSHN